MKFRIHFTAGGVEDSFLVEADTIPTVQARSNATFRRMGLDPDQVDAWSEEIK